jgi:hypothetical protein
MCFLKPTVYASVAADRISTDQKAKAGETSIKQLLTQLVKHTIKSENFGGLRGSTQGMFSPCRAPNQSSVDILAMQNQTVRTIKVLLCQT